MARKGISDVSPIDSWKEAGGKGFTLAVRLQRPITNYT